MLENGRQLSYPDKMVIHRLAKLVVLLFLMSFMILAAGSAGADKPVKIPVAFGAWKGPQANIFKNALQRGVRKECVLVKPRTARVVIEGEVTEKDQKFVVRVIVKMPKGDELAGSHEYTYAKPKVTQAQANKMGHDVTEMARRAPTP